MTRLTYLLVALLSATTGMYVAAEPVRVALRPKSDVAKDIVTVADVADLTGGDASIRERLRRLDLAETGKRGDRQQVSRDQLQVRLLLAGFTSRDVQIVGSDTVAITHRVASIDAASILATVSALLASQLRVAPDDLEVQLSQPLPDQMIPPETLPDRLRIEPRIPANVQAGRVQILLQVVIDDQPVRAWPVAFDVAVFRDVARTTHLISRGETFTKENVASERLRLTYPQPTLPLDDILGRQAQRPLAPDSLVQLNDISTAQQATPWLVRSRDVVRVVARKGAVTVSLAGECLDNGRQGDLVRVRNTVSDKILTARVVGRSELEMRFE